MTSLPPADVARHIVDAHCHPTDSLITSQALADLPIRICAMSTGNHDQHLVADLANKSSKVIPCFGHHPWFSHLISLTPGVQREQHYRHLFLSNNSNERHLAAFERLLPTLPDPIFIADILSGLRQHLESFPSAFLGEVGIDRSFRVAYNYFDSPKELTPFTVPLEHQLAVLEHQIDVAVDLGRNISLHSVKCPLQTQDLLKRMQGKHKKCWGGINIDLHSCGLSPEMLKSIQKHHRNVFCSLSTAINGRSENHKALIATCRPDRLLAESDFHDIEHTSRLTWEMIQTIGRIRNWNIEEQWEELSLENWGVVRHLEENWKIFHGENTTTVNNNPNEEE